jgi:hypothetical protein
MNAKDQVHRAALIFASQSWWKPVIGYIVTNCAKFSGLNFTNEEHDCFLGFRKLYTELFDCFICKRICVNSSALESAFVTTMEENSFEAVGILEMLRNYSDFLFFRQQMIDMAAKIQEESTQRLVAIHKQLEESHIEEAGNVSAVLEEGEELVLERETAVACEAMRLKLRLSQAEVSHFVDGVSSGLTPRKGPDSRRIGSGVMGKQANSPVIKSAKSAILRPSPVRK